jgi:glycine/D-amino acid oxidase-like deaminating enzyme
VVRAAVAPEARRFWGPLADSTGMRTGILVVGGGLGGCAAALAAARGGRSVVLTEATDWVGGQLTAQAVPPDEHPWIERFGCAASYRALREGIRAHYRRPLPVDAGRRRARALEPGRRSGQRPVL